MTEQKPIRRIAILGAGLIGASIGLSLRRAGFSGALLGWDPDPEMLAQARAIGAVDPPVGGDADADPFVLALAADLIILAGPVLSIADWLQQLAPVLSPAQLVTDVGSVKGYLLQQAATLYNSPGQPGWLPGHPMSGKEHSGAAHAEASLFENAAWLFTGAASPEDTTLPSHPHAAEWAAWVERFGAKSRTLSPAQHDHICASVSHLPQFLSTALAAMLNEQCASSSDLEATQAIGARALREMTRLAASPYSMWRDIALTNEPAIAQSLLTLEQALAHLRENLRTPELRNLFTQANTFRAALSPKPS